LCRIDCGRHTIIDSPHVRQNFKLQATARGRRPFCACICASNCRRSPDVGRMGACFNALSARRLGRFRSVDFCLILINPRTVDPGSLLGFACWLDHHACWVPGLSSSFGGREAESAWRLAMSFDRYAAVFFGIAAIDDELWRDSSLSAGEELLVWSFESLACSWR